MLLTDYVFFKYNLKLVYHFNEFLIVNIYTNIRYFRSIKNYILNSFIVIMVTTKISIVVAFYLAICIGCLATVSKIINSIIIL